MEGNGGGESAIGNYRHQLPHHLHQVNASGCYLAPRDTLTIEIVVVFLKEHPHGLELVVAGDLNANLQQPEGHQREEEIAAALTAVGL